MGQKTVKTVKHDEPLSLAFTLQLIDEEILTGHEWTMMKRLPVYVFDSQLGGRNLFHETIRQETLHSQDRVKIQGLTTHDHMATWPHTVCTRGE
jgi:hypothetical protein